jgi:probable rRNA maturation factor
MILNRQKRVRVVLPSLEKFARQVKHELRLNGREVAICLVSDTEMSRLNKTYRGKNKPTDVLSFPVGKHVGRRNNTKNDAGLPRLRSGQVSPGPTFLGDIAIAPSVARQNAKRFARRLDEELRILILHGVLHLMGYDHETDSGQMERRERRVRRRLGLE